MKKLFLVLILCCLMIVVPNTKHHSAHALNAFYWIDQLKHVPDGGYDPDFLVQTIFNEANASGLPPDEFGIT